MHVLKSKSVEIGSLTFIQLLELSSFLINRG
jgi:hypothetical protein